MAGTIAALNPPQSCGIVATAARRTGCRLPADNSRNSGGARVRDGKSGREEHHAVRRKRLAGPDREPTLEPETPDLRSASSFLGLPHRPHPVPALPAARIAGRHRLRPQCPLDRLHRGAGDVPRGGAGRIAPGRRGRVRPGARRRQRQRALWPLPCGGGDCRPCRPEARRPRRAGPRGAAGGQPQPLSRHPPHRHLGPPPGGREPRDRGGARHRRIPRRRPGVGAHGLVARHRRAAFRNCPSWRSLRGRCPT